ncbi:MltR family transcriptional regulator [Vibrio sp. RC27]
MADTINETYIIEQLNAAPSVRGFFIAADEIFELAIDMLTQRIFRSDYLAVKSVINPLLDSNGPLGDLLVRLKLLYGLGVVPDKTFHDIESILSIKGFLNSERFEYQFTDQVILDRIKNLTAMKSVGNVAFDFPQPSSDMDPQLHQLHMSRIQQVIRSSLSLAIVELCASLNIDSPFST